MKKRILLISGNYFPEPTGIGKYNLEMTEWLADSGYEVHVIATFPYYPYWQVQAPYQRKRRWYHKEALATNRGNMITIYRCPHYVPSKPTGFRRILLDLSYCFTALFQVLKFIGSKKKFDYVMTVVPPLPLGLLSVLYKSIRGGKFLYHIQDLQVEAAKELQMIKSCIVIRSLFKMEKYILRHANIVSSISGAMIAAIEKKTDKNVQLFPNWVDAAVFYPIEDKNMLKKEFGFSPSDIIILYSGSIGEKQGLNVILDVAAKYNNNGRVKFVICGSGPYKEALQSLAFSMHLQNIVFFPLQPSATFNRFLNMANVHLVMQKNNASDLVMPSKLTSILAIGGIALITANEGTCLHQLVNKHNMGILVDAEDVDTLALGIHKALYYSTEEISANALLYARKYLSKHNVLSSFFDELTVADAKKQEVIRLNHHITFLQAALPFRKRFKSE